MLSLRRDRKAKRTESETSLAEQVFSDYRETDNAPICAALLTTSIAYCNCSVTCECVESLPAIYRPMIANVNRDNLPFANHQLQRDSIGHVD